MDNIISDAQYFSEEILNKLYPLIDREFEQLNQNTDWQDECNLTDLVDELQREFHSLAYYEQKLVFPCLLENIRQKQQPGVNQNCDEIQRLTAQKEKRIEALAEQTEKLAYHCEIPGKHAIFGLIFLFKNPFREVKNKWHAYLKEISAAKNFPSPEK